jgi:multidrug resistance efflux pump
LVSDPDRSYISSPVNGIITSVNANEGALLSNGSEILFVDDTESRNQIAIYEEMAGHYLNIIQNYQKVKAALERYNIEYEPNEIPENENPFNRTNEIQYNLMYEAFFKQLSGLTGDDIETQRQAVVDQGIIDCERMAMQQEPTFIQYDTQRKFLEKQIDSGHITSNSDGYVHYLSSVYVGMYVQKGTALATISCGTGDTDVIVTSAISVSDRNKIDIGSEVQIRSPDRSGNNMLGHITNIASDSTVDTGGVVYYTIQIALNDHAGIPIGMGMAVECVIVYSDSTWLDWMKKSMGL